jgi:CRISPR-associated endoribonuclease Cas6
VLESFTANRYQFNITTSTPVRLPEYKGSTFRGGFGHAFKKVVCTFKGKECDDCLLKHRCVYSYIFESLPPENSTKMTKYLRSPHPFVIEPPPELKDQYAEGESMAFGLVLIGKANDSLPYFIYAFDELGKMGIGKGKGKFTLDRVMMGEEILYDGVTKVLKSPTQGKNRRFDENTGSELVENVREITMRFLTPTRLILKEKLVSEPDFQTVFRTLLRRVSMLSYFHCGKELDLDYRGLIERAGAVQIVSRKLRWWDWERYSSRQDEKMKLGGFVGELKLAGDVAEFLPFLRLGEMVHVGKGTGFGLGMYELTLEGGT